MKIMKVTFTPQIGYSVDYYVPTNDDLIAIDTAMSEHRKVGYSTEYSKVGVATINISSPIGMNK